MYIAHFFQETACCLFLLHHKVGELIENGLDIGWYGVVHVIPQGSRYQINLARHSHRFGLLPQN